MITYKNTYKYSYKLGFKYCNILYRYYYIKLLIWHNKSLVIPPTSVLQPVQLNGAATEKIIFFHHSSIFSGQIWFSLTQLFPNPNHVSVKTGFKQTNLTFNPIKMNPWWKNLEANNLNEDIRLSSRIYSKQIMGITHYKLCNVTDFKSKLAWF